MSKYKVYKITSAHGIAKIIAENVASALAQYGNLFTKTNEINAKLVQEL